MWYQDNFLQHYGVKGMKWGVRKKRTRKRKRSYSKDYSESRRLKKRRVSELSNEQLRTLNKRMKLEEEYKRLNPSAVKRGLKVAGTIAGTLGTVGAIYGAMNSPWFKAGQSAVMYNIRKKQGRLLGNGR